MAKRASAARVLEEWTERDLTAAIQQDDVSPAFAIDEQIAMASDAMLSGRNLMVAGEPGVGKTALICELVRRAARDGEPAPLAGKRVLQFSFRYRASTLHKPELLLPETQKLIEALLDAKGEIVPFFRDFHLAYYFDVESQLVSLGHRLTVPILGEADPNGLASVFEYMPELEQQYALLQIDEPDFARTGVILTEWAAHVAGRTGRRFTPDALDEALNLSHRFLARKRMPRKALDLLIQVESLTSGRRDITRDDVIERFSRTHHVPHAMIDPSVPLDPEALQSEICGSSSHAPIRCSPRNRGSRSWQGWSWPGAATSICRQRWWRRKRSMASGRASSFTWKAPARRRIWARKRDFTGACRNLAATSRRASSS